MGVRSLFFQFCPARAFHSGAHLHLAVSCLAIVFSCLSQFPYSTCQRFSQLLTILSHLRRCPVAQHMSSTFHHTPTPSLALILSPAPSPQAPDGQQQRAEQASLARK